MTRNEILLRLRALCFDVPKDPESRDALIEGLALVLGSCCAARAMVGANSNGFVTLANVALDAMKAQVEEWRKIGIN